MASFLRKRFVAIALFVVVLAAVGTVYLLNRKPVVTDDVRRGNVEESVYGLGKVKSDRIYDLKLGVTTTITRIFVREGQMVKRGDQLIRFQDGQLFSAPIDGAVTMLPYHESENVFPQVVVLRIEDLGTLYVEVLLEQQGALRIRPGQPARMSLESLRGQIVNGVVEAIFPREDQFVVRVKSEKFPPEVLPGMTADVVVRVGSKENVLLVPLSAVSNGHVVVMRDGRKQKIEIKIGTVDENRAEVVSGDLNEGDKVVVPSR